jgi:hypothetical protein
VEHLPYLRPRRLAHTRPFNNLLLRNLEWLLQPLLLRPRQDLELRHPRRVRAFRFVLPRPVSRALLLHSGLPQRPQRELRHLHPELVQVRRVLRVLLRRAKDIRFVRVRHRRVDSRVPERLRIFVRQPRLDKRVPAGRDPACRCAPEADLLEDILSVPVAPANEEAGRIKDRSVDNVQVRPAEQEFRKLNRVNRFTHGSRLRRVAVRSSKSVMRKANANCIRCVLARVQAQGDRRKLSLSRRFSASLVK